MLFPIVQALASLEPSNGKLLFGAWYDRISGDTPSAIQQRTGLPPFSLWQSDMNIGQTLQSEAIDNFVSQVAQTNSDAILYLTLYPMDGFQNVSAQALDQFTTKIQTITNAGRRVLIRYASEMNGNWFPYGQQPIAFIKSWKQVVDAVRAKVPDRSKYAFIWAPNSGNGYPFGEGLLDTNNDGKYTIADDPYTPFFPGDDYVDWVGFSIYHYGKEYPWVDNVIPMPGQVEAIITGKPGWGAFNFYEMFCETGATVHLWIQPSGNAQAIKPPNGEASDRVPIKQTWWRQIINATLLNTFPKIKAVSTFEFIKFEETTWRDFTNMGGTLNRSSPFGNDGAPKDGEVLKALQQDLNGSYGQLLIWANGSQPTGQQTSAPQPTTKPSTSKG
ncbi:glycoside hydrolase superfamily, partial [Gorgonomyces haynaldii]